MIKYAFLSLAISSQAIAEVPYILDSQDLDRSRNLIRNGSFEQGHPGLVPAPKHPIGLVDAVYWAKTKDGPHNPAGRGLLSLYPEAEVTPRRWRGRGGYGNYAEWSSTWPGFPDLGIGPTGPGLSSAPSHGDYSLYFGNFYLTSINVAQSNIHITSRGEWIFQNDYGKRINPVILPGQPLNELSAEDFRPKVTLSQRIKNLCKDYWYKLNFTVFGEFGHPDVVFGSPDYPDIDPVGPLAVDGFFGVKITGYNIIYLNLPANAGIDALGNESVFGQVPEHTYTLKFKAKGYHKTYCKTYGGCYPDAVKVKIKFINWGHLSTSTILGDTAWQAPDDFLQSPELVLDDVILNGRKCY